MKIQHDQANKSGGVLVLVMVVVLAFSILAIGLFKLHETDALETVYVVQSQQAFWLAESGLDHLTRDLRWDPDARYDSYTVSTNYDGMSYTGQVVDVENGSYGSKTFTLESIGSVRGVQRVLRIQVAVRPGPAANDAGNGGDFGTLNDIQGPVIVRPGGTMDTGNNASTVFHDYILGSESDITGNGTVAGTADLPPDYVAPSLENSSYQAEISLAVPVDDRPPTTNGTTITYYSANVDLSNVNIPAGYKLIFPESVDFGNNNAVLGENVTVLAGGSISFPNHSTIGDGSIIYAYDNIEFTTHGGSDPLTVTGVSLLTEAGDITFASQVTFEGLLFADNGTIYFGAGADLEGVFVAGAGIDKSATGSASISSVNINFNPDLINAEVLSSAHFNWGNSVMLEYTSGSWMEL